jgi:putative effector of murein hydrolase
MRDVTTALACIALTIAAYRAALLVQRAARGNPLASPVLVGIVLTVLALVAAHVPLGVYERATELLRLALGPATVALAIPLYRHLGAVRRAALPATLAFLAGSVATTLTGILVATALGASPLLVRALLTKSVTAAAAVGIAAHLGVDPSLAAALSIATGILGAVAAGFVLRGPLGRDARAMRGLGIGITGHGIGTATALRIDADAGAFATVGMGANALVSAVVLPFAAHLVR